ncbi:hypothetical protein [Pseudomonas aeruginosa]|uniref:hypothetical protein n=1 Tax=Pseudomonas aeruginosa TaxID=287 RepID=UPI002D77B3F6|nr:hypothetical protein [Pseudomonas aeruginosa]WRS37793.1 hypothetical protein U9S62_33575 [Pseudomonas aeruginosa]
MSLKGQLEKAAGSWKPKAGRKSGSGFWLLASGFWLLASGFKLQASSFKLQASSFKLQASSFKLQASSFKLQASGCSSSLRLIPPTAPSGDH